MPTTNAEVLADQHAEEAERLLADSHKHKMQSARGQLAATQAQVHATLAVFYASKTR